MIKKLAHTALCAIVLASFTLVATQVNAANDRFMKVMERGKLVVGVKADYKPWGYRDSSGKCFVQNFGFPVSPLSTASVSHRQLKPHSGLHEPPHWLR